MEHHSNIVPWQMICEENGIVLKTINVLENGEIDLDNFKELINDKTKFLSIVHTSNTLGTVNPIKQLIEICKKHSIIWDEILVCPKRRTDFYMAIEDPDGVALAIADTRLLTENKRKVLNPLISGRYKNWNSPIILDSNLSSEVLEELRYNSAFKNSDFRLAPGSPSKVDRLIMFLTHSGSNIYLNLKEANYILRKTFQSSVDAALEILSYGLNSVLVTNGERTACFAQGNELIKLKPPTVKVSKLTGAGDVLMATHINKLFLTTSNYDAMSFALEETSKFISEGI